MKLCHMANMEVQSAKQAQIKNQEQFQWITEDLPLVTNSGSKTSHFSQDLLLRLLLNWAAGDQKNDPIKECYWVIFVYCFVLFSVFQFTFRPPLKRIVAKFYLLLETPSNAISFKGWLLRFLPKRFFPSPRLSSKASGIRHFFPLWIVIISMH